MLDSTHKPPRSPVKLAAILPAALRGLVDERFDALVCLRARWMDVVGESLARKSRIVALRNGVVTVAVQNSVWLTELQMCRQKILAQLRQTLPQQTWSDIRFRLG